MKGGKILALQAPALTQYFKVYAIFEGLTLDTDWTAVDRDSYEGK